MAPSFPDTGDCVYYVKKNRIRFIQWELGSKALVTMQQQESDHFLQVTDRRGRDAPHPSRVWPYAALVSCSPCERILCEYPGVGSIIFLPVLPVSARTGAWAQRMGRASPRPLGLGTVGGITLNVNIMSRAVLEGQTFKRCSVASS